MEREQEREEGGAYHGKGGGEGRGRVHTVERGEEGHAMGRGKEQGEAERRGDRAER